MENTLKCKMPEIYCAISAKFHRETRIDSLIDKLKEVGIHEVKIVYPKLTETLCISFAVVYYERFWEIDDVLTKVFSKVDSALPEIKNIIEKYYGKIYIDIAFYHYGTYPALLFSGENMRKICYLEADISIDPYDMSGESKTGDGSLSSEQIANK